MNKICFVTGSRAEYGLLRPLIDELASRKRYELQLIITGSHLASEYGYTKTEIDVSPFSRCEDADMLLSGDTEAAAVKSMGHAMIAFSDILGRFRPDLLVLLGDRYEILCAASAALLFRVPVCHLHGGEITEGAFDDSIRHAVTKLSHLHFTSTEAYRNRVIQLGEHPQRVHFAGAIGLDTIRRIEYIDRGTLGKELGVDLSRTAALVTYHPETLSEMSASEQIRIVLDALRSVEGMFFIFTKANADPAGSIINDRIEDFAVRYPDRAVVFDSLGSVRYLSLMKIVRMVIGNSSSGILEAPALGKPVVDIGDRQKGRIRSNLVVNAGFSRDEIVSAVRTASNIAESGGTHDPDSPYGDGTAAVKIADVLDGFSDFRQLLRKSFFDVRDNGAS